MGNMDKYVQSDTLLLADVFENFRNTCLEIYELDSARFLTAPGLAWQAALKKTKGSRHTTSRGRLLMVLFLVETARTIIGPK